MAKHSARRSNATKLKKTKTKAIEKKEGTKKVTPKKSTLSYHFNEISKFIRMSDGKPATPEQLVITGRFFSTHKTIMASVQSAGYRERNASQIYDWFIELLGREPPDMNDPYGKYIPPGDMPALRAFAQHVNRNSAFTQDGVQLTNKYVANIVSINDVLKAIYRWYLDNHWSILRK